MLGESRTCKAKKLGFQALFFKKIGKLSGKNSFLDREKQKPIVQRSIFYESIAMFAFIALGLLLFALAASFVFLCDGVKEK